MVRVVLPFLLLEVGFFFLGIFNEAPVEVIEAMHE